MAAGNDAAAGERAAAGVSETASSSTAETNTTTPRRAQTTSSSTSAQKSASSGAIVHHTLLREASTSSLASLAAPTLTQSPRTSRNNSPTRKDKPVLATNGLPGPPSAASIQRALSTSSVPSLLQTQSAADSTSRLPRKLREGISNSDLTQAWPTSPRLRSPPPGTPTSKRPSNASQKRSDSVPTPVPPINTTPAISVQGATPQTPTGLASKGSEAEAAGKSDKSSQPASKPAAARGTTSRPALETVQENSSDTITDVSPAVVQATADLRPLTAIGPEDSAKPKSDNAEPDRQQPTESGSESTGNKSDGAKSRGRRNSNSPPSHLTQRPSRPNIKAAYPLTSTKVRPAEGKQNMTVETETVQSIPQSGLTAGDRSGARNENGSVRQRPSNETIRPKKERKKADRKPRSINQGTATSKADLFEARVASAVDEVNSSDSDETFVYESNPPEAQRRQRHHSRTPSVASSHSVAEASRGALRSFGDTFDGRRLGGKRSMKFSSNAYNDTDSPESNMGTVRSHTPRHIGRFGRNGQHSGNYESEAPYPPTLKSRPGHLTTTHGRSSPHSPRSPHNLQYQSGRGIFGRKQEQPYDFDAEQNADDETAPLLSTIRGHRGHRTMRRIAHRSAHNLDDDDLTPMPRRSWRVSACVVSTLVIVLVLMSAVGIIFSATRPLYDVRISSIQHVLASEQELMLDLLVAAVNPNTIEVSVTDIDLDIFARSKHFSVGGETEDKLVSSVRRSRLYTPDSNPSQEISSHWHLPWSSAGGGHDHGTDPPADSEPGAERQTLFLGRAFHLDEGLSFAPSPIQRTERRSIATLRVSKPGNKTETDGSEKWEKVVQFPFELIVKGVLKYQVPISSRNLNVPVEASVMVHPEDGVQTDPVTGRAGLRVGDDHNRDNIDEEEEDWNLVEWPQDGKQEIEVGDEAPSSSFSSEPESEA